MGASDSQMLWQNAEVKGSEMVMNLIVGGPAHVPAKLQEGYISHMEAFPIASAFQRSIIDSSLSVGVDCLVDKKLLCCR